MWQRANIPAIPAALHEVAQHSPAMRGFQGW